VQLWFVFPLHHRCLNRLHYNWPSSDVQFGFTLKIFPGNCTAAGSSLGWHCAAVCMFRIYSLRCLNFLSCFGVRQPCRVSVFGIQLTQLYCRQSCLLRNICFLRAWNFHLKHISISCIFSRVRDKWERCCIAFGLFVSNKCVPAVNGHEFFVNKTITFYVIVCN
jgi:hypothetical protein